MKFRDVFISVLLLFSNPLLVQRPALSAEKVIRENSAATYTIGPVTSSVYFHKPFIKRQAAFIRRNPTTIPSDTCDDIAPKDPTGIIKIICKTAADRKDRILEAADSKKCLKVRWVNGTLPTPISIATAVSVDNSKYCK